MRKEERRYAVRIVGRGRSSKPFDYAPTKNQAMFICRQTAKGEFNDVVVVVERADTGENVYSRVGRITKTRSCF